MQIIVDNIKCGGCAHSVKKGLLELGGVNDVEVDVEAGSVTLELAETTEETVAAVKAKLQQMGYPERGSVEGLQAAGAKAKSFVSCAVGKISKDD